jgi:hypothetical protein
VSVDPRITRAILEEELAAVRNIGGTYGWEVTPALDNLQVLIRMHAYNDDEYLVEITADDYKELPPIFEFIEPDTGKRGTPRAYPKGKDTFFNTTGVCICAPFCRKAYKQFITTGPHADWKYGDWTRSKAQNFDWSNVTTLADMLGMIQRRIIQPELYEGRMG